MLARKLLAALCLCALAAPIRAQVVPPPLPPVFAAGNFYPNIGPPRQQRGPVFASSCSWNGSACTAVGPAAGTWGTVDFTLPPWNVPADATAALLNGILIITHGTTAETADLWVIFRAPGDTRVACDQNNLIGQTVEAAVGGGQRSNMSTIVPLVGGKTEWCWRRSTSGTWPTNSSYGINLSIHGYFGPSPPAN